MRQLRQQARHREFQRDGDSYDASYTATFDNADNQGNLLVLGGDSGL